MSKALNAVLAVLERLSPEELAELAAAVKVAMSEREHVGKVTYRQEYVTKKSGTKCGPYWYAYHKEGGKLRKRYIGKKLPADLEARAAGAPELPLEESNEHA